MKKVSCYVAVVVFILFSLSAFVVASEVKEHKTAIVLASFGTSYPDALKAITNIGDSVKKAFPNTMVKYAFTSNIIRKIWHKRQNDENFKKKNKSIAEKFCYIKGPLATIADLQDKGYDTIVVQSTHIYAGEEYANLCSYIDGLNSIKTLKAKSMPFNKLVIGRPALGKAGTAHDYHEDIEIAAKALASDVKSAAKKNAALVYMGHGNEYFCTGAYIELQDVMNKMYPKTRVFIGTVEGFPSLDNVIAGLKHTGIKNILLKPFMIVAGDHANNDMASDEEDSWKTAFTKMGINVQCDVTGVGENDKWADIYVNHIAELMKDNNIK